MKLEMSAKPVVQEGTSRRCQISPKCPPAEVFHKQAEIPDGRRRFTRTEIFIIVLVVNQSLDRPWMLTRNPKDETISMRLLNHCSMRIGGRMHYDVRLGRIATPVLQRNTADAQQANIGPRYDPSSRAMQAKHFQSLLLTAGTVNDLGVIQSRHFCLRQTDRPNFASAYFIGH